VVITPRADRSQFFARTTTGAVGLLVASHSARITFDVATSYSEANGCEDLDWVLAKSAGSVASIACDPSRPSEAILKVDPRDGSDWEYQVSLVVNEPSGLRSRSNSFRIFAYADSGELRLVVVGPLAVPPYGETDVSYECRRGLWGVEQPCPDEDRVCFASAPVLMDMPMARPLRTEAQNAQGPVCRVSLPSSGQKVTIWVAGPTVSSEEVEVVAQ
jgi:hypothetical protein